MPRDVPWSAIVTLALASQTLGSFLDSQGPTFLKEPPPRVDFSNTTGGHIDCSAHGSPAPPVTWLSAEGKPIASIPGTREMLSNGTLVFLPFQASSFRQDVHSATYRCVASNVVGKVVSRDVKVRAVVLQHYEVQASAVSRSVSRGGTAVLRCLVPSAVRDLVTVTSWLQDASFNIYPSIKGDGKYHMLPSGELLVRNVDESDKYRSYQCRAVNRLSGATQLSQGRGARIVLEDSRLPSSPRLLDKQVTISVRKDQSAVLPCVSEGYPPPATSWYRQQEHGQLRALPQDERLFPVAGGLAVLHVQPEDAGKYVCLANNSLGSARLEVSLHVSWPLTASVQPPHATVDMGRRAQLTCTHEQVTWLKDGQPVQTGGGRVSTQGRHLVVERVQREDAGMYQCFVRSDDETAQGTAELRLGAAHPQLVYKFIRQTLQPGPHVSLKCIATGNPTPQLRWTLDGFPLPHSERFLIGQYVTIHGDVISHVNISSVQVEDGGTYQCAARNRVGEATHSADLRIYGLPSIREMPNVSAVAGEPLYVTCPVAGYPIDTITWEKGDRKLPLNRRQHVFSNGTLLIENVQREADQGTYTCMAANKQGRSAFQSVALSVIVPPRITPFSFQTDLHVGDRAGVQCFITKGDLPLQITWQRDGVALPVTSSVVVRQLSSFVSSLSIDALQPDHAANYTCVASNSAASAHHSSQLLVNVPPRIGPFTFGDLIEGVRTQVQCVIQQGDPPLNLTWLKDEYPVPSELGIHVKNDDFSSTLVIPVVSLQHSGNYTCIAGNQAKETRQSSSLVVSVPPRWLHEPRDQNVTRDNSVQFECQAEGFPTPTVIWRKVIGRQPSEYQDLTLRSRGLQLFPNGSLLIRQAFQEHQGQYLCEATNGIGAGLSAVVFLTVHVPPEFEVKSAQSSVRRGAPVTVRCEARGDGPMSIAWQREAGRVLSHSDPRFHVKESATKGGFLSDLTITSTLKSDSGTYTCVASNPFGRDHRAVHLLVQDAPGRPQDVRVIASNSNSVRIGWHAASDERSPVLQYVVQYHEDAGSGGWDGAVLQSAAVAGTAMVALVAGLSPATLYRVRVLAENEQGAGEPSDALLVRTDSDLPTGAPQGLTAEPLSSSELRATWLPPPRTTWNGDLLGYYVGYRETGLARATGYNFTTVPFKHVEGTDGASSVRLAGLKKFRKYGLVVQAFNEKGSGPMSSEVVAHTLEDVPGAPPADIQCHARGSQGLALTWQPPPHFFQNGVIQGYKVAYENVEEWPQGYVEAETKVTLDLSTELHGLQKFSNYTIQIWAFTRVGDGEKSGPIFCHTDEDVPEAPADVKVFSSTPTSLMVSWMPPARTNGLLSSYNVYTRVLEAGQERNSLKKRLPASQTHCEFHELSKKEAYEFWVTGSTKVGEGQSTQVVYATVSPRVPAAIISFGRSVAVLRKARVQLGCLAVGVPEPERTWLGAGGVVAGERLTVQADGSLLFRDVQKADEGNYTCSARNEEGLDQIHYTLHVQVAPTAPVLHATAGGTSSLNLRWEARDTGGSAIRGFVLNFRRGAGEWEERVLARTLTEYMLRGLECGTEYQLYLIAANRVGSGAPSEAVVARTEGSSPGAPSSADLVNLNMSTVTLNLKKWEDNGCAITSFTVDYRERSQGDWINVGNIDSKESYSIVGLWPGTHYVVRVVAVNSAGSTSAEYPVTTYPALGGTPSPSLEEGGGHQEHPPFYTDLSTVSTMIAAATFLLVLASSVCVCLRRRGAAQAEEDPGSGVGRRRRCDPEEDASVVALNNKHNLAQREQYYAAVQKGAHTPVRASNALERIPEYAEDIYPYATFHVQSQPPANFQTFLYPDHRLSAMETIPLKKSPAHHDDYTQLRQHKTKSFRSESEDYDSLGSDSESEQPTRSNLPRGNPGGGALGGAPAPRRVRDGASRRHNVLYPAPCTSTEASPQPERRLSAGANRRPPIARTQHSSGAADSAAARRGSAGGMVRGRSGCEPSAETSFSSGTGFPGRLEPPSGFSDGLELSEAECDMDTLRRLKLRQHTAVTDGKSPAPGEKPPREARLRNFTITV